MNSAMTTTGAYKAGFKAGAEAMKREGWKPWQPGDEIPLQGSIVKTLVPTFSGWIGLARVLQSNSLGLRIQKLSPLPYHPDDGMQGTADLMNHEVAIKSETIEEDGEVSAWLPVMWATGGDSASDGMNGPPVEDAGTIYVTANDGYDERLLVRTTIAELVEEVIDMWRLPDGSIEKECVTWCKSISETLRKAAEKIDAEIIES